MTHLDQQIQAILERNQRVETDKAWEMSFTRRSFITLVIYSAACLFFQVIGRQYFFLHAFIPTGAYIFSTLTLPPLKKWWLRRRKEM